VVTAVHAMAANAIVITKIMRSPLFRVSVPVLPRG
jgi:hypothetical protein